MKLPASRGGVNLKFKDPNELFRRFNLDSFIEGWSDLGLLKPSYNIAPTQFVPVVVKEPSKHLRLMSWGLIPSWAKDQVIGQKMINARSETLTQKPSFKRVFVSRRCIVPATGFYEWAKEGKQKVPMHFVLRGNGLMGLAGLWDIWKYPDGEGRDHYSFTIISTSPNELLSKVHNRMPVILRQEDEDRWLDPSFKDTKELLPMLKPYPAEAMEGYPVSRTVNSPAFNGPECTMPVGEME